MSMTQNQMAEIERETAAAEDRRNEIATAKKLARLEELAGHVNKQVVFGERYRSSTEVRLSHWQRPGETVVNTVMIVETGAARLQFDITPDQARNLAFALRQHADEVEEREQLIAELQESEA